MPLIAESIPKKSACDEVFLNAGPAAAFSVTIAQDRARVACVSGHLHHGRKGGFVRRGLARDETSIAAVHGSA